MGMALGGGGGQNANINVTPLIDVLLVLLFFFMVATTFRHHADLKINLPEAEGREVQQQGKVVNLLIDAKGAGDFARQTATGYEKQTGHSPAVYVCTATNGAEVI